MQRHVTVGGTNQGILLGEVSNEFHLAADAQKLCPAYGLVDDDKAVSLALLGHGERFDRAVEQTHQATDLLRAGDIALLLGSLCPRKHAAD